MLTTYVGVLSVGNSNPVGVVKVLKEFGIEHTIVSHPEHFRNLTHLIIPGVGAFDFGIKAIKTLGLHEAILDLATKGVPILGICLGMHLLATSSSEGQESGLNLIPGNFTHFSQDLNVRAPHLGWNTLKIPATSLLLKDLENSRFYFNHSYALFDCAAEFVIASTFYGENFVSVFAKQNVFGVQFHPEKSHRMGRTMIHNFISI